MFVAVVAGGFVVDVVVDVIVDDVFIVIVVAGSLFWQDVPASCSSCVQ